MFCPRCSIPLPVGSTTCLQCQLELNKLPKRWSVFAILGFWLSFIPGLSIVGFVFSLLGLLECRQVHIRGRALAIVGMVLPVLSVMVLIFLGLTSLFLSVFNSSLLSLEVFSRISRF